MSGPLVYTEVEVGTLILWNHLFLSIGLPVSFNWASTILFHLWVWFVQTEEPPKISRQKQRLTANDGWTRRVDFKLAFFVHYLWEKYLKLEEKTPYVLLFTPDGVEHSVSIRGAEHLMMDFMWWLARRSTASFVRSMF